jgi:hypothetical protein
MRLVAHFGQWLEVLRRGRKVYQWQVAAELIYGQVKKIYRRRKLVRVTHVMRLGTGAALTVAGPRIGSLGTTEHRFYRAGESHCPSWGSSLGTPHVGYGEARPTAAGASGMVASLLSFCATPYIVTGGAHAATRTRWQTSGTTRPSAYSSDGSEKNQLVLDSAGSAVLSSAAGATHNNLSVNEVTRRP